MYNNSISEQKHQCPCGQSFFTVKKFHDRNGLFEEYWEMSCNRCKQGYQLDNFLKETENGPAEAYFWVPRNIFSDMVILEAQLHKAQKSILALAHEMYLEQWTLYCYKGKTKREIWNRLTSQGKREPGYKLFDRMATSSNMADYLKDYFNYQNMDYVLKKLNVRDSKIDYMTNMVGNIKQRLEKTQRIMRNKGFINKVQYAM